MTRTMLAALLLALPFTVALAQPADAPWSFEGREVERRSTSPTELLIDFTLLPEESPVQAVVNCVQTAHRNLPQATFVSCAAFTPPAYTTLSGSLRLCYSAIVQWFGAEGEYRLSLPQDDPRYPRSCPERPAR